MAILDGLGFRGLRFLEVTADRRWAVARNIIVLRSRDPATPLDPQHSARIVPVMWICPCGLQHNWRNTATDVYAASTHCNPKP